MTIDARLDKLYPALSAQERATLILRAWKAGEDADPRIRRTAPDDQVREVNSLIRILRALNGSLAHAIQAFKAGVDELPPMVLLLQSARLFEVQMRSLVTYIAFETNEPITASDHAALVASERERYAPLMEFGELLADRFEDWKPSDIESGEGGDPQVKDAAWERVRRSEAERVRRLAEKGVLPSRGKGSKMTVHAGGFFGWLGAAIPVYPEWAPAFDIRPDTESDEVAERRRRRDDAREVVATAPEVFARTVLGFDEAKGISWKEVVDGMALALRDQLEARWVELLQMELLFDDEAARFGGEDPAGRRSREACIEAREVLGGVHEALVSVLGPFELPVLTEELKARARNLWTQILEHDE